MKTNNEGSESSAKRFPPKNKKQLSALLGVSIYILNKWVSDLANEIGPLVGKVFSAKQVTLIVEKYGCIETEEKEKKK